MLLCQSVRCRLSCMISVFKLIISTFLKMESKKLFNIFNIKNKSITTSLSSTVSTKINVDQNISVSTATNTNIVNDDESINNNTSSGCLDLGDLNSGPMRPILKVSTIPNSFFVLVRVTGKPRLSLVFDFVSRFQDKIKLLLLFYNYNILI